MITPVYSRCALVVLAIVIGSGAAQAQWNPSAGEWGKTESTDIRVMTFNVGDGICRNAIKTETYHPWHALARIVAAMKPDVLILQEAGDNSGNGTPGGGDSVSQLTQTCELFIHGGSDPFLGGSVGAYVQKYAPTFDLPYIFVNSISDGYNRNVVLSRFPFADLNGDGESQHNDIDYVSSHLYAPGGGGGIRGFMFAELDLPDAQYGGDFVIGNAHLKAFGGQSEHNQRVTAAKNVAYYIDHLLNGAGTGGPDPYNKISDYPSATAILDADTPVVIGGDWNEDETKSMSQYGEKGPASWFTQAAVAGGSDGTDRDRSDMTYDSATEPYSGDRSTQSGSKLDYIAWQDSVANLRRAFVFNSFRLGSSSWYPPEIVDFTFGASGVTSIASDHRPVIVDLIMPAVLSSDYDVTISTVGDGDVTLDPPGGSYPAFTEVELTADPDPGNYFIRWEGDLTGSANPATVIVADNLDITAVFDDQPPVMHTVTLNISGQGAVDLDPPGGVYIHDEIVTLTADPDDGWYFVEWQGDASGSTSPIDVAVDSDLNITAVFEPLYTLTINVVGDGRVDVAPDQTVFPAGATANLTAVGLGGEIFIEWQGDLTGSANPAGVVMDSDKTITAVFGAEFPCGDANCDGEVNSRDIDAFVMATVAASDYFVTYPDCDIDNADTNGDGYVDSRDIDTFVLAVLNGGCQ